MAATPRYVVSSDNENHAESSPDPLAASFGEHPIRARQPAATRAPKQSPLTSSSPSKQNRIPNMAEFELSSPTKQMLLRTPRTGGQSPWRIKVTVQAEPGSESENLDSPIAQHFSNAKTTKVPLKDADASSPVKRRGRPAKSEASTKRNGTPVRKRASSKARRSSVGDASAADVETDGTPKRKRGRPRKTQPPVDDDDIWSQARRESVGGGASQADVETDATPKKRRGRPRKRIQPPVQDELSPSIDEPAPQDDFALETPASTTPGADGEGAATSASSPAIEPPIPTPQERKIRLKSTPTQTEVSQKLQARKNTPIARAPGSNTDLIEISSDVDFEQESEIDADPPLSQAQHQHRTEEAADHFEDFEPVQAPAIVTEDVDGEQHDETHFAFDEGATRMPDDTTIIDSENFSMISVDSLPSCASVTRPANGPAGHSPTAQREQHLSIPYTSLQGGGKTVSSARSSSAPSHITLPLPQDPRSAPSRYKTPSEEPVELDIPPPIRPARVDLAEAQTPRIGRVVRAGVALQGVLDPNRATPEAGPSRTVDERREHLDDLFRGFSERTRRELHAGLRLGEQLAKQNQSSPSSSPPFSSPIKAMNTGSPDEVVAGGTALQQHRLLTPEDQDNDVASAAQPTELEYPILPHDHRSRFLSPVSNPEIDEDEMSWSGDTPPAQSTNENVVQSADMQTQSEFVGGAVPDIWEENAGRSSASSESNNAAKDNTPQIQDLFAHDGPVKSTRGKLSRTRRRKAVDDFQYSDEVEVSQVVTPPTTESDESPESSVQKLDKANGQTAHTPAVEEHEDDRDDESEASDDTGTFFQANLPNLFNKKRSREFRRRRARSSEVSLNLDESLLPESSPPQIAKASAMDKDKTNPFLNTPPQLAALISSPAKSSPLRRELRSADISSESAHQTFEESTLPMPPSSPFRTFVDGDTGHSMASDQRQFMHEIAGTDSSLRRIRDEADDYLDAYKPQERELEDVTELTEPSRTWNRNSTIAGSSNHRQTLEKSILKSNAAMSSNTSPAKSSSSSQHCAPDPAPSNTPNKAPTPVASRPSNKEPAHPPTDPSTPLTSSPAMQRTTSPPPLHPTLNKLDPLPRIEPWTKTHYKALDKLYQLYKKSPSLFSPTSSTHAALNTTLLTNFLNATTRNFIGARYRAWGYNVVFTDALVVLAAAYMQLLTLGSVREYEERVGKEVQMGDCAPGREGEAIIAETVVERLATVVLGEAVRRDEKRGRVVDKSGRLRVEWPV
ncbi:hypothetical protein BU23DRAFT_587581 [Bimuria novae-zelandiae CBS 107.79]|uniref:Uncharacterized protein n=1 Tax=Bimuria novae-zelandiae CBS 107.79 TaxID=1447943 RepID=A0A6A5VK22_9PLEO|nr:hypothetical protein BU23DRAFT_587581 [Bimuria novae-zelandiae CBS 107.79]